MLNAAIPSNDVCRVAALRDTGLLDTPPEERFDRYTRLARRLFKTPIALVSLVDESRQWFKSRQGLDATETPRNISFCGHAIHGDGVYVVENTLADERFVDNPLVIGGPQIRFYAGCPLVTPDGYRLGTFCIIDTQPRVFSDLDAQSLRDIAESVTAELYANRLATIDPLTGLSNRRAFVEIADKALALCVRNSVSASLMMLDLDGFKKINDTFGHDVGDCALKAFSDRLLHEFRGSDVIARFGGDEFCILLTGSTSEESWECIERFRSALEQHNKAPGIDYDLQFSAGIIQYDVDRHGTVGQLLEEADHMMYRRKRAKPRLSAVLNCAT